MSRVTPPPPPWPDMREQFRELYAEVGPLRLSEQTGVSREQLWRLEQGHTENPSAGTRHLIYGRISTAEELGPDAG